MLSGRRLTLRVGAIALLAAIVIGGSACGQTTTTTTNASGQTVTTCTIHFAKTKFVLHAGIATGAFYRYILQPYRKGAFKKGAPGRKKALAKGAASGALAIHELRVASRDARCDGPALRRLAQPIASALDALTSLRALATGGGLGAIGVAAAAFDNFTKQSAAAGAPVSKP